MKFRPVRRIELIVLTLLLAALGLFAAPRAHAAAPATRPATKVTFESDGKVLTGFLYAPDGAGPWPALVWNHGSEQDPGAGPQFDTVASVFVPAGCSFGGIETLLAAESGAGFRAAIALSPAALTWDRNEYLRDRLVRAAGKIDIPTLVIQPAQDASLAPARVLAATAARLKKPLSAKVYPPTGSSEQQQHCFGGARGMHVWAADAVEFFRANLR